MNFPTVNNPETNSSKHSEWPESDIWSEHSFGYQGSHFRPFGNRAGRQNMVLMVEDPANESNRTREPSPDSKQLADIVRELKKSNDELKANNQLLTKKLEQTNQLVQQGFNSLRDAISSLPGQISQNLNSTKNNSNTATVLNSPLSDAKISWPLAQWTRTSDSSSIISSVPEDLTDEIEDLSINPSVVAEPLISSRSLIKPSYVNNKEEMAKLSQAMKEKFGFEYDNKVDFDLWLRK